MLRHLEPVCGIPASIFHFPFYIFNFPKPHVFHRVIEVIGAGLMALGMEKGDKIALLSESRSMWILAELGALYAGATDVPLSVNLNKPGYFVCYNQTYFPNTSYHPAPGDMIMKDHILGVVIKTGIANAYTVSISSPAMVIFRARGTSIQEFVSGSEHVIATPGSSNDYVTAIPYPWILDAVEVFDGRSTSNAKRLPPLLDAGFVFQSDIFKGHTLGRKVDEAASKAEGYEILMDTNNSTNDFQERQTQSLHE